LSPFKEKFMGGAAHFKMVIIASLAGILFGFDTAVIAGTTHALRDIFSLSPAGMGVAVSAALWGTLLGALIAGQHREPYPARLLAAAADRVHRVVRHSARSGDLGLLERDFSDRRALAVNLSAVRLTGCSTR